MNRVELERYAEKLAGSGLSFARGERDGSGNLQCLTPIPWHAAIVQITRLTGWRMIEADDGETPPPLRLEP